MKASAGMWLAALGLAPAPLVLAVRTGGRDGLRKNGSGAAATDGGLAPVGAAEGDARRKLALGNECVYAATDFPPDTDSADFTAPLSGQSIGLGGLAISETVVYSTTLEPGCSYTFELGISPPGVTQYIQLLDASGGFPFTPFFSGCLRSFVFTPPVSATPVYLAIDTAEGGNVGVYGFQVFASGSGCSTLPPTSSPTAAPTSAPTAAPTSSPTAAPTAAPTSSPTSAPTSSPAAAPTKAPTSSPTAAPTKAPTPAPTLKSGKASAGKSGKASNGKGKTGKAALINGDSSFLMDDGSMSASMSIDLGEEDLTFFNRRG